MVQVYDQFEYNDHMTEPAHILIIEDDKDINEIMATSLSKQGYLCTQAFSGSEARLLLNDSSGHAQAYDLIITDLMLPGASGEELIEEIRAQGESPIMVVSARNEVHNKVDALKLGADDYLVKPFDLDELGARVAVQLRHRFGGKAPGNAHLSFKDWELNPDERTLIAAGIAIKLTRLEYGIVEALVRRPRKVFTKQELFKTVWNEDYFAEERAVTVHLSNIRTKLKPTHTDSYLETVWGIGIKLVD